MGTKQENLASRQKHIDEVATQLAAWSTQLDDLVAGYLSAGAGDHDPYRVRIDELQAHKEAVQTRFDVFNEAPDGGGPWGAFRSDIKDDWVALEAGFKDLTR